MVLPQSTSENALDAMLASSAFARRLDAAAAAAAERLADVAFVDAARAQDPVVRSSIATSPSASGAASAVAAALGRPAVLERWAAWERVVGSDEEGAALPGLPLEAGGAWVALPLRRGSRVRGALSLWRARDPFSEEILADAAALASLVALGLEDAIVAEVSEEARADAERRAAAAEATLREAAHALRTPLSSALLWLGVLRAGTPSTTSPLDAVEQCLRQMQSLLERPRSADPPRGKAEPVARDDRAPRARRARR